MDLSNFDRRHYIETPTPIEPLSRLSKLLGMGVNIYVKRDDMLPLGGSKTRPLEFLMADALKSGADCVITCGRVQSNHCRITLTACIKEGLLCYLVIEELISHTYDPKASGNNYLYRLLGAERLVKVAAGKTEAGMQILAAQLHKKGKRPYIIPAGGSNVIGALGYTACAAEITEQQHEQKLDFEAIVVASGSGGTHAGLVVGFHALENPVQVIGISVENNKFKQTERVCELICKLADTLHIDIKSATTPVRVDADFVGNGYSLPTPRMNEAIRMFARNEGILLDPVYSGKAGSGLIDMIRRGVFKPGSNVLLIHTGGIASLFHYMPL